VSTITTDQGIVHYEVYGRGRPVILLHGWLGSWYLWQETMKGLQNYRTYALDFWGFGESGKKRETYNISDFVSLVEQFMDQLGIVEAPIIGHSMGGTVTMAFAIQNPDRVTKAGVIGSPVKGESLAFLLKLAGMRFFASVTHNALWALNLGIRVARPLVTKDKRWPEMIQADLSQTTLESFLLSIKSLRYTDLTEDLQTIPVPLMGIYGKKDVIVNPNQHKLVQEYARFPQVVYIQDAGHFPMLDHPDLFVKTVQDFLAE
jgi:pimeloyl-ACP methyl ester carboxylesterase